jgi:broad specificity phosphatase PhoE
VPATTQAGPLFNLRAGALMLAHMRLFLLRHGQSEWNADGRWQGQADPPLSELGLAQAREAASKVGSVDAILASPLERAWVTASVISEHLGVGPVQQAPGLVERYAGEWQGLTREQIEEQYPGYLAARMRPPGWEPDSVVEERAMGELASIAARYSAASAHLPSGAGATGASPPATSDPRLGDQRPTVLVVGHSGVIYAIETLLGAKHSRIANLEGRWFEFGTSGWQLGERLGLLEEPTVPGQL